MSRHYVCLRSFPAFWWSFSPCRSLFTQEFLGVSVFKQKRQAILKLSNAQYAKDPLLGLDMSMRDVVLSSGQISSLDVKKCIYMSSNYEAVEQARALLRQFVTASRRGCHFDKKALLLKHFAFLCHSLNLVEPIHSLWNEEAFMEHIGAVEPTCQQLRPHLTSAALCYLDLLYENEMDLQVLLQVQKLHQSCQNLSVHLYTLAMMSCLRLNSRSSLDAATNLLRRKMIRFARIILPYALLAYENKNYQLAFEAASFLPKRAPFRESMMIMVLCRLNRIAEAIDILDKIVADHGQLGHRYRTVVPEEALHLLVAAVNEHGSAEHKRRLWQLCRQLDRDQELIDSDRTLLQLVAQPIDCAKNVKRKRELFCFELEDKPYLISEYDNDPMDIQDRKIHEVYH